MTKIHKENSFEIFLGQKTGYNFFPFYDILIIVYKEKRKLFDGV